MNTQPLPSLHPCPSLWKETLTQGAVRTETPCTMYFKILSAVKRKEVMLCCSWLI